MNGKIGRSPGLLLMSASTQNRSGRLASVWAKKTQILARASRILIAGAFIVAQPLSAGAVLPTKAPAVSGGYAEFLDYVRLDAAQPGAAKPEAVNSGASSDDYAALNDFLQGPDNVAGSSAVGTSGVGTSGVAPADEVHAALRGLVPSGGDAYAVLTNFVQIADNSGAIPSGAFPSAISAQQEAAVPAKTGADDLAILGDFAGKTEVPTHGIVLAAGDKAPAKKLEAKADAGPASFVGSEACVKCHRNQFGSFAKTLHGDIFLKQPRTALEKQGCESCHGPASQHIKAKEGDNGAAGDIISFRKDSPRTADERNAICLTCHEKSDRTYWQGSAHETRGLACTDCHQIMEKVSVKNQMLKSTEAETCFQCHKDRRAQMARSSHMPVANGDINCSSCHNPHGSATDKLLREASVNETCYKCHADKRGPFLWEHEPVRDNCLNCHEAHGTVNEFMLKAQRPRLCQQCHMGPGHGNPGNPMTVQSVNRSCQNCHTKVHGSNSPAGELFQR